MIRNKTIRNIGVYGCGGTGSHVINGLAKINNELVRLNCGKIYVTAFDPDVVSHYNVGRQAFFPCDVGQNKAKVLTRRVNDYFHLNWSHRESKAPSSGQFDLVISCVDTKASRKAIAKSWYREGAYLMDCGNARTSGQVLLGQFKGELPNPYEENPQLWEGEEEEDDVPTCTDHLARQDLFINNEVAIQACHMVWEMTRFKQITKRGVFFDISKGICNPINIERT